jgi:hypothetical protein
MRVGDSILLSVAFAGGESAGPDFLARTLRQSVVEARSEKWTGLQMIHRPGVAAVTVNLAIFGL